MLKTGKVFKMDSLIAVTFYKRLNFVANNHCSLRRAHGFRANRLDKEDLVIKSVLMGTSKIAKWT